MKKGAIEAHLAVFLFGFAGLFGKIIPLSSMQIVFGRTFFASIFLLLILKYMGIPLALKVEERKYVPLLGAILALHWFAFFHSIQSSTVAIGLITFSTFPIFTALLEPLFFKEKIVIRNIFLALVTFLGIILMLPSFNMSSDIVKGVLWGTLSGFTFSILTIINRKYVRKMSSMKLTFYQNLTASLLIFPLTFLYPWKLSMESFALLAILGILFTGIAHTIFIHSLRSIKAHVAGIIASLEPLYGIILAVIIIGEIPGIRTIIGGSIVILASIYASVGTSL